MISFIMMAKNTERYIGDAISALQKIDKTEWELIVVDDHSEDNTYKIAEGYAEKDRRVKVYKNKYKGKVKGTNYGYSLSKGDIIKCIDSDDVLLPDFFDFLDELNSYDAHCHNAYVTDKNFKKKYLYNVNPYILTKNYEFVLENLVSIPKWSWSFKREVAEKIFPMPESLPFEDVWMSLTIKKFAQNIHFIDKPVYYYRQHENQTFGGIVNFNKDVVVFRANRQLKLIDVLKEEKRVINGYSVDIFDKAKLFNTLMAKDKVSLWEIFKSDLCFLLKVKLALIKKFPLLAKNTAIFKWKLEYLSSKI